MQAVEFVARRVQEAGGRALLVGGAVIDIIQGREPKDLDLEVYSLGWDQLVSIFVDCSPKTVGAAFGILKIQVDGADLDLNIPRTDNKVGLGHSDFAVVMDPRMSVREAARRRDFTINTLARDPITGELHDPFGGLADLEAGILRATDPELFVQDPLRALRAMQLLARKAKTVEPATVALIRGMVDEFDHLAPERVFEEWRKLLLKAEKPSVGLQFLVDCGWIVKFPELSRLRGVGQSPEWHPEGDVWTHSLLAVDAAAQLRASLPEEDRELIAFSALLHDVGKFETTVTPEKVAAGADPALLWTAYGHDQKGMEPADRFMQRLTGAEGGKVLRKKVTRLVGEHMQPFQLSSGAAQRGAWSRLHRRLSADGVGLVQLASVCRCDACATSADWRTRSLASGEPNWEHRTSEEVLNWAEEFQNAPPDPKVLGRHLIERGVKPGPKMGELLKKCLELQDANPAWGIDELIAGASE
jgi:tRNA nucleotidyltransferase (CCA-adding enzyme)